MKHRSKLYQLIEQTSDPKERMNARLRKRRQRDREKVQEQSNPLSMILVVKNKMNGEILIIDKESYTPKYHEIIIAPDKLNQAVLNDIVADPKFVQTETSKRLLGDVKGEQPSTTETATGAGGAGGQGEESGQQMSAQMPVQQIPFTANNIVSGPMIAIGMMGGLQSKDLLKLGVSEDELNEFNSSQEIQAISMKIAKDIAYYFKNMVGRDIREYEPSIIKNQMFQTSEFWKKMGGFDSTPKADIVFRHKCVIESLKDKKCAETMCACTEAGIVPSEQVASFTMKFGPSPILSGKMNNETQTIMYSTITFIDMLLNGGNPIDVVSQFNEKEKDALEKLREDIKFIKNICKTYFAEKINQLGEDDVKKKLELVDKLAENIHLKIERILNSNILYQELFLHEAMSGYLKFGPKSPAYAESIIAILPEEYSVAMDNINLDFVRKIINENTKFVVNMKSQIDESPDEKVELEACKIRYGGKCPKAFTPKKFIIRNLLNYYLSENNKFKYSPLKYLTEQTAVSESEFVDVIESATGLMDLMNIFAIKPEQITVSPIDFFIVTSTVFSADKNIINVNGKTFKIPVHMDPIPVSDQEQITESTGLASTILEKLINLHVKPKSTKRRDYRKEYKKFQSSKKAKLARAARVRNRRIAERKRLVRKGDKIDIDHIDGNPTHNYSWNLHRLPRSVNRAKH
jgi:hypothetical protein